MTRPCVLALLLVGVMFGLAARLDAQPRWRLEILPGGALVTDDPLDTGARTGFGAEGNLSFRLQPHLAAYAGWDWHRFTGDSDVDIEETGYAFGLRFDLPLGAIGSPAIALRVGGTWNRLEIASADPDVGVDSGHGLGWEIGGGLAVPVADRWTITPGLRYRATNREFQVGTTTLPASFGYATVEVGIALAF